MRNRFICRVWNERACPCKSIGNKIISLFSRQLPRDWLRSLSHTKSINFDGDKESMLFIDTRDGMDGESGADEIGRLSLSSINFGNNVPFPFTRVEASCRSLTNSPFRRRKLALPRSRYRGGSPDSGLTSRTFAQRMSSWNNRSRTGSRSNDGAIRFAVFSAREILYILRKARYAFPPNNFGDDTSGVSGGGDPTTPRRPPDDTCAHPER